MNLSEVNFLLDALQDKLSALPFHVKGMSDGEIEDLYDRLATPGVVFPPPYIAYLRRFGGFQGDFGILRYPASRRGRDGQQRKPFPLAYARLRKWQSLPGHADLSLPFQDPVTVVEEVSCFHVPSLPSLVAKAAQRTRLSPGGTSVPFFPVCLAPNHSADVTEFLDDAPIFFGRRSDRQLLAAAETGMEEVLTHTCGMLPVADITTLSPNPRAGDRRFNDILSEHICAYQATDSAYGMDI